MAERLSRRLLTSVRVRVTAAATLAVVAVLVVAGAALVEAQRRQLVDLVDEAVEQRMAEVVADTTVGSTAWTRAGRGADTVAQVVDAEHRVLAASPVLGGEPALSTREYRPGIRTVHDVPLEGGEYRLAQHRVDTRDGPVTVLVAGSMDDVADSTAAVTRSLVVGIPVVAATLALVVWLLVGRLLRRVDAATRAQQRFVADAAHELRTPLARMRTELEVDLAHPETSDPDATGRSLLEETVALQHLADDLLLLARTDAGGLPERSDPVDLDAVVTAACRTASVPPSVTVDATAVAPVWVRGDAGQLGRAVANVVDNALGHARSTVRVSLEQENGRARIVVADDGPGIPPADRERVFERFTRLDDARAASSGGSGLGLAITREIVEHHGGTVHADASSLGGAAICITLPAGR